MRLVHIESSFQCFQHRQMRRWKTVSAFCVEIRRLCTFLGKNICYLRRCRNMLGCHMRGSKLQIFLLKKRIWLLVRWGGSARSRDRSSLHFNWRIYSPKCIIKPRNKNIFKWEKMNSLTKPNSNISKLPNLFNKFKNFNK